MALSLTNDACYAALASRDARFDGHFYVAVSSTGIYCRPICRVRLPAQKNCEFFESAARAESQGYRPCLRCRPELSTRWCTETISESLAAQGAQLLDEAFTDHDVIQNVSARLGVTDRHLRRLLNEHLGVTPTQYIQTARLLFAKQLLTDTHLPVGEVALIAGFGSVRRFNTLLKSEYGLTPTALRKSQKLSHRQSAQSFGGVDDAVSCRLTVIEPYDFESLLSFHSRRAIDGLEVVDDHSYLRAIALNHAESDKPILGWYRVTALASNQLQLDVSSSLSRQLARVMAIVRAQFDIDSNPNHWLPALGALAEDAPGLRVPGGIDGFELAVRAILGQQITVEAATTLLGRVVDRLGGQGIKGGPSRVFPTPKTLSRCHLSTLGKLGVIESRGRAIQAIARAVDNQTLNLSPGADVIETRRALKSIPGVGDWTANYLLMRALRWPDAFIDTDLGIVKAANHLGFDDILRQAEQWRPWRAYAAMHLWQSLARTGDST